MKGLKRYIEKVKPNFEKGGKYERFQGVFESFETFLVVPGKTTPSKGAHIRDAMDSKRLMSVVVIALIPALLFGMWNAGHQHFLSQGETAEFLEKFWYGFIRILPIILVSYIAGLGTEFVFVYLRNKEIEEGFLVSGMLIPLIVPIDIPLWMVAVATIFAVLIGKEAFGGTGMNIVNPALLARAFLFFAYPSKMSGDKIWIGGLEKGEGVADGFSGATPLADMAATVDLSNNIEKAKALGDTKLAEQLQTQLSNTIDHIPSFWDAFMGWIPGSVGETSVLMILIGAAILLYTGVGSWRIMLSVFVGGAVMGGLMNLIGANPYMDMPFYYHLVVGGFAFGAVFMATDPVTASQTTRGKWIYGFLIGVLAVLVRVLNPAYPEGMMLAILLMNVFSPLIDHYIIQGNIKKRLKRAVAKA
jgi:Na+-transporting NADH:ubiquinone oxidoreductase subunit B